MNGRLIFALVLLLGLATVAVNVGAAWHNATTDPVPEDASAGFAVWGAQGCEGCHTLYGQGGGYAPDLTRIIQQRGADYLRAFMVNPGAFHPDQRQMPRFTLTETEVDQLIALLDWTSTAQFAADWPPRPLQVAGGGALLSASVAQAVPGEDPVLTRGRAVFGQRCASCHSIEPGVVLTGPSLAGIADRAWHRVIGLGAAEYIRNSILHPSDYLVEGFADVMQKNFADLLSSSDIDALIAYLMQFGEASS